MAGFNFDDVIDATEGALDAVSGLRRGMDDRDFEKDGFILPPMPVSDGTGFPSSKVPSNVVGGYKRHTIHWFVPDMGIVKMYVNPQNIVYSHNKQINSQRTKGGYVVQYWGEELPTLSITGTTGSSGVEGINVLYELYRAEQYAFDPVGLTLAAEASSSNVANSLIGNVAGGIGSAITGSAQSPFAGALGNSIVSGITGMDPANNGISSKNLPSLASIACGIEMFYMGWVFRGYFNSFNFTESANDFNFTYDMKFTVTQRRGYRVNYMPWHKSAISGASHNGDAGNIPYTYNPSFVKSRI